MQTWRRELTPVGRLLNRTRKSFRPQFETLEDRTTPTMLLSIAATPTLITDLNAPGTFQLKLVFDGSMNSNIQPAITFPTSGENPGASLVPNNGFFTTTTLTNDTFVANYSSTDQNVSIANIDVRVSGAVDFSGSAVTAQTLNDIFSINTTNPIVTNLQVSDTQITASDVGSNFIIQVTYRDQMQTTTNPTIAFSQNVSNTLTFTSGAWNGNGTIYSATYHIIGSGVVIPSVNVSVSGALNLAGFTQLAYSTNNVFSINTSSNSNSNAGFPVGAFTRVSGDFNGDGLDDVAAYYASNGKFLVALSTGSGFLAPVNWLPGSTGLTIKTLLVGDFNNDGKADLAFFYNPSGVATWHVLISNGSSFTKSNWANDGTFGATGWTRFLVGDFNNDGFTDIAAFQNYSGTARWIVNLSTGTSFTVTRWASLGTIATTGWFNAVAGDFNGDGKTDIANFYRNSSGTVARWYVSLSNGASFTTSNFGNMPNAGPWSNPMAGDFNGDGKDDIVTYNATLHQWFVSVSSGTAFTSSVWLSFVPSGTIVQQVGDFNHDGKADLSIVNVSNGQSIVALSNGSNFAASVWEILPASPKIVKTVLVGDFTGDGKPDLGLFLTSSSATEWWVSKNNFPTSTFTTTHWR